MPIKLAFKDEKLRKVTPDIIDRVERYCEAGPVLQRALCADLDIPTGLIPQLLATGARTAIFRVGAVEAPKSCARSGRATGQHRNV
ncbi:hypothetical protein [Burkholderia cepacia]|uniref:hypothetical protein n=1 Tax=Burkholderia cepacia TaxID=292 RepID=UPI001CF14C2B|nr:hypothetical protein [Burkholderia cepacia]MCA8332691.1 hypothetical protein [Burkholderia cepacia]